MDEHYVIVTWPDSQVLMEEPWFDEECYLINDDKGISQFGSSAYFVPVKRIETTLVEH